MTDAREARSATRSVVEDRGAEHMNQRGVTLIATYLKNRPLGRIVQVRPVSENDYIVAIGDRRDGRTHLIHSSGDLRLWLEPAEDRLVGGEATLCHGSQAF